MSRLATLLLLLGLAGCATTGGLESLVLEGHELHVSLEPKPLSGANHGVPQGVRENPHFSTDADVVEAITRNASQGQRGGDGLRAALFALYRSEKELGFYGVETESNEEADRVEGRLREIWSVNVGHDIARVHRGGRVFVVVWHDGVSPDCWQAVNDGLAERLGAD